MTRRTTLIINGEEHVVDVDHRTTLLDLFRHHLDLNGAKKGCDHGQCGACTIIVNGQRINACLTLACMHDGDDITTIEGLGTPTHMSALQRAFVKHDGFQCGYCTAGQICSATAMLEEAKAGWSSNVSETLSGDVTLSDEEISERMSGNLCRCSGYAGIVSAIREAVSETDQ